MAYQLSDNLGVGFVLQILRELENMRVIQENAFFYSDQGCHYTSIAFQQVVRRLNLSMSSRDNY